MLHTSPPIEAVDFVSRVDRLLPADLSTNEGVASDGQDNNNKSVSMNVMDDVSCREMPNSGRNRSVYREWFREQLLGTVVKGESPHFDEKKVELVLKRLSREAFMSDMRKFLRNVEMELAGEPQLDTVSQMSNLILLYVSIF